MRRKLWLVVVWLLLAGAGEVRSGIFSGEAPIDCGRVKAGVGYLLYFQAPDEATGPLDQRSASRVLELTQQALDESAAATFNSPHDLALPPFSLAPDLAIKPKRRKGEYELDGRALQSALSGSGLGYVLFVTASTSSRGPVSKASLNDDEYVDLPVYELDDGPTWFHAFNFISFKVAAVDLATGKVRDYTNPQIHSYRTWFVKKFPDFINGKVLAPPGGGPFSAVHYQEFLRESLERDLKDLDSFRQMDACPREQP